MKKPPQFFTDPKYSHLQNREPRGIPYKNFHFGDKVYVENPEGGKPIRHIVTDCGAINEDTGRLNKTVFDDTLVFLMVT